MLYNADTPNSAQSRGGIYTAMFPPHSPKLHLISSTIFAQLTACCQNAHTPHRSISYTARNSVKYVAKQVLCMYCT